MINCILELLCSIGSETFGTAEKGRQRGYSTVQGKRRTERGPGSGAMAYFEKPGN
jgi:hypothetical protein